MPSATPDPCAAETHSAANTDRAAETDSAAGEVTRIVVAIDESPESLRALGPARVIADATGAELIAASVVAKLGDRGRVEADVFDRVAAHGVSVSAIEVHVNGYSVAQGLESVTHRPGVLLVLATEGHSRTRPLTGSVAEELVHARPGEPTILVGPQADLAGFHLDGPVVVCVDPEQRSAAAEQMARSFGDRLSMRRLAISVLAPSDDHGEDLSAVPVRTNSPGPARRAAAKVGSDFKSYIAYGPRPTRAIVGFADEVGASILTVGTHRRDGLSRMALGSVAIRLVSDAHCPVLVVPEVS